YMKQTVPRWLSTDKAIVDAYVALVDKVCPCVLLLHSQGGAFGFKVAEQRPDKVKAIVAVESATAGDVGKAAALKSTPTLMLFGNCVDQHPRWAAYKKTDLDGEPRERFAALHVRRGEFHLPAGESHQAPSGEVLVAAVDRVGKHSFHRVRAHGVEEGG